MRPGSTRAAQIGIGALLAAAAVVMLIGSGYEVAHGHVGYPLAGLGLVGVAALLLLERGPSIAVLVLGSAGGIPFIDSSRLLGRGIRIQDLSIAILIAAAGAWATLDSADSRPDKLQRRLSQAGLLLIAWWFFTLVRTVLSDQATATVAAGYGRDFLYFAILLTLLPRVSLSDRDIRGLLVTIAAGVCLFAVGQILDSVGVYDAHWLVHTTTTAQQAGVTRVYTQMTDLVVAVLAVSAVAMLTAPGRLGRQVAPAVTVLLTVSIVLQLGRARWIGLLLGIVTVVIWIMLRDRGQARGTAGRRLSVVGSLMVIAVVFVLIAGAGSVLSSGIGTRILSVFSTLASGTGTFGLRQQVLGTMTGILGGNWPVGLGFIPPSAHYYFGLPSGSLRDVDLGVMGAVMTMGAIGAVLIYSPVVQVLLSCLRQKDLPQRPQLEWMRYGGAVWIVATLITSATLITLFSASGLTITVVGLTLLTHSSVIGDERAPASVAAAAGQLRPLTPQDPRNGHRATAEAGIGLMGAGALRKRP